ncbi:MAG TPA: sigma-54 dependent transcriptional regulator, partial [Gemmatimonadales bacterium]
GDPLMQSAMLQLDKVSRTNSTVLLLGESGTGKELAARFVHEKSPRADGPFVPVNCAAISETLMESEIFGHEKGAFTGALAARRGRLELAAGGTFFLDEIGELEVELQAKLLRVVQERRFERVGGTRTIEADVRWIAATNRDLTAMISQGTFREDLCHRLAVFPVQLPPLRVRRTDLLPLAESLLARIGAELGRPGLTLDDSARDKILGCAWPGNVRELANALERAAILTEGDVVRGDELQVSLTLPGSEAAGRTMAEIERDAIRRALDEAAGNRRRAARRLGIGERTLYDKLRRYGIN